MVKTLIATVAVMAVIGSAAMACSGHSKGGKGGSITAAPAKVILVTPAKATA